MKVEELRASCEEKRTKGLHYLIVTLPRKSPPRGEHVKLCGRFGPKGVVLNYNEETKRVVAAFDVSAVLKFLDKMDRMAKADGVKL